MKILIVALDHVGSLGWYIKRALLKIGHQVEIFDYRKNAYIYPRKYMWEKLAFKVFRNVAIKRMNINLVNFSKSFSPDLIIVQKGEIVFPETIRKIKKLMDTKIVVWHADSPFSTLISSSSNIIYSLSEYDACFVFDPYYIPKMRKAGSKRVKYLPFASDPDIHRKIELSEEEKMIYGGDICFIGNFIAKSKRTNILKALVDFDLKIWGNGWERARDIDLNKLFVGRPAYGEEMVKIYNACKISINIHHEQSVSGVNMRTFEAPACGCFLLSDEKPELANFYKIEEEIVCYKDITELREKLEYYLENSKQREEIAKKAQEKIRKNHTYTHRMAELIEFTFDNEN